MIRTSISVLALLVGWCHAATTRTVTEDGPSFGGKIKHVVAIMFENRSFDHMIGFLRANRSDIDGCLPDMGLNCSNPLTSDSTSGPYYPVGGNAVYIQPGDPSHSCDATTEQLYGSDASNLIDSYPAPMNGFIESYSNAENKNEKNDNGEWIMQCFTPETLPILSTLANEFAVYDRWFADFPGCTEPNRLFSWLATSGGMAKNDDLHLAAGFTQMSIFELIDKELGNEMNNTWKVYFEQVPTPLFIDYTRVHPLKFGFIDAFFQDVANGELPLFSWIDPAYSDIPGMHARDQHPDHDVTEGEKFLKRVYESLRESSLWNDTLLMIFYDEHGGFFDHVSPPLAPNPDGKTSTDPPFNFNRLGLRVPAVFVSPWIKKGTIGPRPNVNESQFCHSSLIHTMRKEFMPKAQAITKRDEWSQTFEDVINLDEMRQDCPTKLPNVPDGYSNIHPHLKSKDRKEKGIRDDTWWTPGKQATSDFQRSLVVTASSLCDVPLNEIDQYLVNQETCGKFLMQCMEKFLQKAQ